MNHLAFLYWDPDPDLILLPIIDHPIRWYGLFFVIGFMVAYRIIVRMLRVRLARNPRFASDHIVDSEGVRHAMREGPAGYVESGGDLVEALNKVIEGGNSAERRETLEAQLGASVLTLSQVAEKLTDRLAWFVVIGTIVGARLGHCIFYDWARCWANPWKIVKVWEGGLASHGGAIGIILSLIAFLWVIRRDYPWMTFLGLCDLVAVPTGFVGFCIRCGNFVNQEILGVTTQLPWAVLFGHPADGSLPAARHPVQLYEAFAYLALFAVLWRVWRHREHPDGYLTGLFFLLCFGARFILEYWKVPQVAGEGWLHMGQLLSMPFIAIGAFLVMKCFSKKTCPDIL